jgi:1,2-diacylglycerol 3-alpha-glucosyltransferase
MENQGKNSRLRIAIVIDAYDDCKNGAAISTKRFVNMLRNEHDVFLVTTGKPGPGKILLPKFYPPFVSRVMRKMKTPLALPVSYKLRKIFSEVDLIHVQFPFLLAIRSIRLARKLNIPVITTFHIQAEHLAINAGIRAKWFISGCYKIWLNNIYNLSDLVICPSKFAEDELKRYGLTSPSVVISNGILPGYKPIQYLRNENWNGKFIILSVGRFSPEKRHQMIIEAINRSKFRDRIQLILIGEGPMKNQLEKFSEILPHKPVFLTLPAEELIYYYNIADLYVHAASIESEGMTILEAMGCGLPLLLADSPKSAARQFALEQNSLFNCADTDELVKRIDFWVENPEMLNEAKERYTLHSQKYRIENSYEKLVRQYFSVINNGKEQKAKVPGIIQQLLNY